MSYLIRLLLPRSQASGNFAATLFQQVRNELTQKFGGVTVYSQAPAEGLWKPESGKTIRDEVVLFEVMTDRLAKRWWKEYRTQLEERFEQAELLIRAQKVLKL